VTDTGCGIRTDEMGQLFQPFQRVGDRNRAIEGAGLGLVISRRLVELLGGALYVESVFGQGSRFWFELSLPAVDVPERAPNAPAAPVIGYRGPRRRVLIADDKRENRAVLVDMLAPLGFRIAEAGNGQEALDVVGRFQPDVVLMDMRMPVLDGLEATRRLRQSEALRDVIVIAVSASAYGHHREQYLAAGADDFLSKPFQLEELLELLRARLGLELVYASGGAGSPASQRARRRNHRSARCRAGGPARAGPARRYAEPVGAGRPAGTRRRALRAFRGPLRDLAERFQLKKINELLAGASSNVMNESTTRRERLARHYNRLIAWSAVPLTLIIAALAAQQFFKQRETELGRLHNIATEQRVMLNALVRIANLHVGAMRRQAEDYSRHRPSASPASGVWLVPSQIEVETALSRASASIQRNRPPSRIDRHHHGPDRTLAGTDERWLNWTWRFPCSLSSARLMRPPLSFAGAITFPGRKISSRPFPGKTTP
jgi:CheY-like chemotaxis protein